MEFLGIFVVAAIVGFVAWAIAYIVPPLNPHRNAIGLGAFLIVLVIWLLQVLGVGMDVE